MVDALGPPTTLNPALIGGGLGADSQCIFKCSCTTSNLQWPPGNHCSGMLPLYNVMANLSVVQLVGGTSFRLVSAT